MKTYIYNKETKLIVGSHDGQCTFGGLNPALSFFYSELNLNLDDTVGKEAEAILAKQEQEKAVEALKPYEPMAKLVEVLKSKGLIKDEDLPVELAEPLAQLTTAKTALLDLKTDDGPFVALKP